VKTCKQQMPGSGGFRFHDCGKPAKTTATLFGRETPVCGVHDPNRPDKIRKQAKAAARWKKRSDGFGQRNALRSFAIAVIREWWNNAEPGDVGGDTIQELAEEHGLWVKVPAGTHFVKLDNEAKPDESTGCENCEDGAYECGELASFVAKALKGSAE
jgi:hypothetical protein